MADPGDNGQDKKPGDQSPVPSSVPLKPVGEVEVTHLDIPPSVGKRVIHPRRPAPVVPDRREDDHDEDGGS